jgi:hypothetical protein
VIEPGGAGRMRVTSGRSRAIGISGTVYVTHGHGECPLLTRLRTQAGEAPVFARG